MTELNSIDPRTVSSRVDLAAFVQGLAADFETNADAWENVSVSSYLNALSHWLGSADSWSKNMIRFGRPDLWLDPETPSWQLLALALKTARTYE